MGRYDDIINLPHHQSAKRSHMPMLDRAAQFAPFAALVGYEAKVDEAARLTDRRVTLTESKKEEIDAVAQAIAQNIERLPRVRLLRFAEDEQKEGGAYVNHVGTVKKIDAYRRTILFDDGLCVGIDDVFELELQ